jgi:hypothetical protein
MAFVKDIDKLKIYGIIKEKNRGGQGWRGEVAG